MHKAPFLFLFVMLIGTFHTQAQQEIQLYDKTVPNATPAASQQIEKTEKEGIIRVSNVVNPSLYAYFPSPDKNTGKAVLIIPGGGYGIIAIDHEGHAVAKEFAESGVSAFVLKYRLPSDEIMLQKAVGPLQDAQRGLQIIREQATQWKINPQKIGVMGFSAGGHLASTLGTHYNKSEIENPKGTSLRPDFMVLVYPVISMKGELTHIGSRENLLGKQASPQLVTLFSNEEQVSDTTPPTFLIHAQDDEVVVIENSIAFQNSLKAHGIPNQFLVYPKGGHGFGLLNPTSDRKWFPEVREWMNQLD